MPTVGGANDLRRRDRSETVRHAALQRTVKEGHTSCRGAVWLFAIDVRLLIASMAEVSQVPKHGVKQTMQLAFLRKPTHIASL